MINAEDIKNTYTMTGSMRATAKMHGVSHATVRKILISEGLLETERLAEIRQLAEKGLSDAEIAKQLCVSLSTVNAYSPYRKGVYNSDNPTENALKIRKHRGRDDL